RNRLNVGGPVGTVNWGQIGQNESLSKALESLAPYIGKPPRIPTSRFRNSPSKNNSLQQLVQNSPRVGGRACPAATILARGPLADRPADWPHHASEPAVEGGEIAEAGIQRNRRYRLV